MKQLLVFDSHDYLEDMPVMERHSVRALIVRDGKIATQHGLDGSYKLPGGGIEPGETELEALAREVKEETGLLVIPDSVAELGELLEIRRDRKNSAQKYILRSFCYTCEVRDEVVAMQRTPKEIEKGYQLVWAKPEEFVDLRGDHILPEWRRDSQLVQKLLEEGYFAKR